MALSTLPAGAMIMPHVVGIGETPGSVSFEYVSTAGEIGFTASVAVTSSTESVSAGVAPLVFSYQGMTSAANGPRLGGGCSPYILHLRDGLKVGRVHAVPHTAYVVDDEPHRDSTVVELVRQAVDVLTRRLGSAGSMLGVAVRLDRTRPQPARRRLLNLLPETFRPGAHGDNPTGSQ